MVLKDTINNLVELVGILCPMYYTSVFLGLGGTLIEIFIEVGNGVSLDGAGFFTKLFPLITVQLLESQPHA